MRFTKKPTVVQLTSPLAAALALLLVPSAEAASYTFVGNDAAGSGEYDWNDATNWSPATAFPNAVGDVANVTSTAFDAATNTTAGFTGPLTLDLNIAITVGVLNLGDSINGNPITIERNAANAGTTASLTLNNGGAGAFLADVGKSDLIKAPLIINDTGGNTISYSPQATAGSFTLSGGVTGTGNLAIQNNANGTLNGSIIFSTAAVNNTGTITASGTSTGTILLSGGVGSNVTGVTQNGNTSALTITTLGVNANGTTLTENGTAALTLSGAVTGTGNLVLNDNSATAITLSTTSINNAGLVTNSGTGAGQSTISGVIGSNVTGVTENSATSALYLSGTANTFTGPVSDLSGTLYYVADGSLGNAANAVRLGNTSGNNNVSFLSNAAITTTRNITVQSGNTGIVTIGQNQAMNDTVAGTITLGTTGGVGHGVTLSGLGSGTQNFSAVIADPSGVTGTPGAVTITSTGAINELSGANTFAGGVNLVGGNLSLNNATALGTGTLTINGGNFNEVGSTAVTLTGANPIVLDQNFSYTGGAGATLNLGTGAVNLGAFTSNATSSAAALATRTVTVSAQTLTFGGAISNSTNGVVTSLTKAGAGTLVLNGANAYTGGTLINAGFLQFGSPGAIPTTGLVTINSGGSLLDAGAFTTVSGYLASGKINPVSTGDIALTGGTSNEAIDFTGYTNLMLGASANTTYTGTITPANATYRLGGGGATLTLPNTNTLTGANNLVIGAVPSLSLTANAAGTIPLNVASTGTVQITNANNLSGTTTLNAGTLNLSSTTTTQGALTNSVITVNGGTLAIDTATATNAPTSVTRAAGVTLNGGTLTDTGNGIANTNDVITGALNLTNGANVITMTPGAKSAELSAGSLTSGTNGYAFVNGANLGRAAVGTAGDSNIVFATTPTLVGTGTTSGGVTTTQQNTGIIANLVGEASTSTGFGTGSATPNTFLTYDTTTGLRPLAPATEFTQNAYTSGNNTRITATTVSSANTSINSLILAGGGDVQIANGTTLTDASGAILFAGSYSINEASGATTGTLGFGAAQGNITVNSGLTGYIGAPISGSNGLTKFGSGTLYLNNVSTYTGATSILNGTVFFNADSSFGAASTGTTGSNIAPLLLGDTGGGNSVTLQANAVGPTNTISRNVIVQGGNTGTVTIANFNGSSFGTINLNGTLTLGSNGIGHDVTLADSSYRHMNINGVIQDPAGLTGTPGNVTYQANGNTYVAGNNTYTGNTIINNNGFEVQLQNSRAFGFGTLIFNGSGGGISGGVTFANNQIWAANLFTDDNANLTSTGTVTLGLANVTVGGGATTFTLNGVIADGTAGSNQGITFQNNQGNGTFNVNLNGANTFDGGVTLSTPNQALALTIGNLGTSAMASALGTGTFTIGTATNTTTINSSVSGRLATNNAEIWSGNFTFGSNAYLNMGNGAVSLGTVAGATRTVTVSNATGNFETDGVISNGTNLTTATTGLTKAGPGTLILGGNSTYSGPTAITAGTLQIGNGGTTGSIANSTGSSLVVTSGALAINRSDSFVLGAAIIGNSGIVSGAGGLTQAGTGNLTINNAQTYTGATTVNGSGILTLSGANGGTLNGVTGTALTFSGRGGTFNYDNTGSTATTAQGMGALTSGGADNTVQSTFGTSGSAKLTFASLAATRGVGSTINFVTNGGGNGTTNKIAITAATANTFLGTVAAGGTGYFFDGGTANADYAFNDTAGFIRGVSYGSDANTQLSPGGATFTTGATTATGFTTTGYEEITGAVTAQTATTIAALQIAGANNLTLASGNLTVNGILKTGGNAATISGGTGIANGGNELVIRPDQASDSLTISNVVSGTGALTKSGAGTLVLSGANTYTGATTVNAGTLTVDSANTTTARLASTPSIVLNNSGTLLLANSGTTASTDRLNNAATVTMAGGMLNLGGLSEGAAGTSGVGALTLTATSTLDFGPQGTSNLIQLAGVGTHTPGLGGVLQVIDWEGTAGLAAGMDRLLFAGTSSSFMAEYAQSDVSFNGGVGYGLMQYSGYYEVFGATPVPEPSTWVGGVFLIVATGWRYRRQFVRRAA